MPISKENLGCAVLLLLVVILSLAKVFNIFIDTPLARIVLLVFILFISYLNKILGLVSVLFVIIIFSGNNMIYREYFDTNDMLKNNSDIMNNLSKVNDQKEVQKGDNSVDVTTKVASDIITPTSSSETSKKENKSSSQDSAAITSSIATSNATEGFDIIGLENEIKRGKQSNTIPVNSFMKESQFISAVEENPFINNFVNLFDF